MPYPVALAALTLCLVVQTLLWRRLRPARPMGDEGDYLGLPHAASEPALWVRVPLHGWAIRLAARLSGAPDYLGPRALTSGLSVISVGMATAWVEATCGPLIAAVTALALLASVERAVLALHLWPDIVMGMLVLAFGLAHQAGASPPVLALIGAVALGLRIEGGALLLAAILLGMPTSIGSLVIAGAALAAYTAVNGLRYGIWRPDTTIAFNALVARVEEIEATSTVQETMMATIRHRREGAAIVPGLSGVLHRVPGRVKQILGPETFVTQNVLGANRAGYAVPALLQRRLPATLLRHGFTGLALVLMTVLPVLPPPLVLLWAGLLAVYAGLQSRSRYRMALLPLSAAMTGLGLARVLETDDPLRLALGLALALSLALFLRLTPERRETG